MESEDESQPNIVQAYYQKVPREKLDKYFVVIMEGSHHRRIKATRSIEQQYGNGLVQFLPGDIKGLETKLNYLLGEYRTGNRSSYLH